MLRRRYAFDAAAYFIIMLLFDITMLMICHTLLLLRRYAACHAASALPLYAPRVDAAKIR